MQQDTHRLAAGLATIALHGALWWLAQHTTVYRPHALQPPKGTVLALTFLTPPSAPAPTASVQQPAPATTPLPPQDTAAVNNTALEKKALYSPLPQKKQGAVLDLRGWEWDSLPTPNDPSSEIGKLVFEVTVDENGDVIAIHTLEKTVSPQVAQCYKEALSVLTFSPTEGTNATGMTTGRITFLLQPN